MQEVQQSMASPNLTRTRTVNSLPSATPFQTLKDDDRSREKLGAIMDNRKGSTQFLQVQSHKATGSEQLPPRHDHLHLFSYSTCFSVLSQRKKYKRRELRES
ncbi:hypothetical protein NC652_011514 [Populus alba x Populus x berolinensis]|nr:hypothetical protein NC652_011514 [Populus alba x Populus x berolinensis]